MTQQLTPVTDVTAWRDFIYAHAAITRRLDADLQQTFNLTLSDYEVLLLLGHAGDCMRMSDIAEKVLLSRSGMTRLIRGLEEDGIVTRKPCSSDGRVSWIALTESGRELLDTARAQHLATVRELFNSRFSEEELETFGAFLARLPRDFGSCACSHTEQSADQA